MPIQLGTVPAGQTLNKLTIQQKHVICIVFNKNKFAHTMEILKEQKILDIYQLNILRNIIFMYRVENKTAPSIFLAKLCKSCHAYPTSFSTHNFLLNNIKIEKR